MKMTNVSPKNIKVGVVIQEAVLPANFQYVKFEITDNNGNAITTVGDLSYAIGTNEYPSASMTGFNTPGPEEVYDFSSYYQNNSLYEPWKAFDNATGTNNRWLFDEPFPQHVSIDLGTIYNTEEFNYIKVLPGSHNLDDYTSRAIKDFNVYISQDNITWYIIHSETDVTDWESGGTPKYFYIT